MHPEYFRPWRSWITQQIPILKNGGSNPFGWAIMSVNNGFELLTLSFLLKIKFFIGCRLFTVCDLSCFMLSDIQWQRLAVCQPCSFR